MPLNLCEVQEVFSNALKILGPRLACCSSCVEGARKTACGRSGLGPAGNICR